MSNENNEEAMSSEEIEKLARERVRAVVEKYESMHVCPNAQTLSG